MAKVVKRRKNNKCLAVQFTKAHILPMQQLVQSVEVCTFPKTINHAGFFNHVSYKEIKKVKEIKEINKINEITEIKGTKSHRGVKEINISKRIQKTFITKHPVNAFNTQDPQKLQNANHFRVKGILAGKKVVPLHLQGPVSTTFMEDGISPGGTPHCIGDEEFGFGGPTPDEIIKACEEYNNHSNNHNNYDEEYNNHCNNHNNYDSDENFGLYSTLDEETNRM